MSRYINGQYLENNPTWHIEDTIWKAKYIIEMLHNNNLHPNRIAEVGCGTGGILRELQSSLPSNVIFDGFDISPQAIEIANKYPKTNQIKYHNEDIFEYNTNFDLLLCIDVFEHIEDYYSFLRKIKNLAKYILFHIPLELTTLGLIRGWPLQTRKSLGHLHHFSIDTASMILNEFEYEIINEKYINGGLEVIKKKDLKSLLFRQITKYAFSINPIFTVKHIGGWSLLVLTKCN